MEIRAIEQTDRKKVGEFITRRWFSLQMVVHGESIDLGKAEGLYAIDVGEIVGLVTFSIQGAEMEILSLDSIREGEGIGTTLLERAVSVARASGLARVMLVTTNDNVSALCFYQRRGASSRRYPSLARTGSPSGTRLSLR